MKLETNFSILKHNTFGIDAKCNAFVEYTSIDELRQFIVDVKGQPQPILHIGGGSNLLFLKDFEGIILHSKIKDIEVVEENDDYVLVKAGAGVVWDDFVQFCVNNNFYGAENLSYIPGEVGASPVQNVGAYGVEAKDIIFKVEVVDAKTAELIVLDGKDCGFGYRYSNFKGPWKDKYYVHHVVFKLGKSASYKLEYGKIKETLGDKPLSLKNIRETIVAIRKDKLPDPKEIGSAGSFFTNPVVEKSVFENIHKEYENMPFYLLADGNVKIPAGWLIEQCGWKGKNYKNVGVYEKQSLIIVNRGGAIGAEVAELAQLICADVKVKFGIVINPEVCYI